LLIVVPVLLGLWMKGSAHLMAQDPELKSHHPKLLGLYFWRTWQKTAVKTAHLPTLMWLIKQSSRYLSPKYNPMTEADTALAQAYLARSPAAQRAEIATLQ
jgi:predicted metal-dependent hydrolase